jgi:Calcineurin-like phosphoesterase superfamily domain
MTRVRIGILSDIHEAIELLEVAIERLSREAVDRFLVLGDVFETGPRIDEAVGLLESVGAVGVYGNHDYGLSVDSSSYVLDRFSPSTLAYMRSLLPRMELEGYHFAHREPCLDCSELTQIWHVDEEELPAEAVARSFDAVPDRPTFIGHFHCWRAFNLAGPISWEGQGPLVLPADSPTLVVIAAICDGHAAILNTEARVLTPVDLYEDRPRPEHRPIPRLVHE